MNRLLSYVPWFSSYSLSALGAAFLAAGLAVFSAAGFSALASLAGFSAAGLAAALALAGAFFGASSAVASTSALGAAFFGAALAVGFAAGASETETTPLAASLAA